MRLEAFDADSGESLEGVEVRVGRDGLLGSTGPDGRLDLRILEGRKLGLVLRKEGFAELTLRSEVNDEGALAAPRFPMRRMAWIEGVARDGEGGPVAGAWVMASNEGQTPLSTMLSDQELRRHGLEGLVRYGVPRGANEPTDDDGWVVLADMPGGAIVNVRAPSKVRLTELRHMERLPEHGEHVIVLEDNGERRVDVTATATDDRAPDVSVDEEVPVERGAGVGDGPFSIRRTIRKLEILGVQ